MENSKISIIIRTYNEEKHIGKLLAEVSQQRDVGELEIVIVDSGSQDETIEIVRNFDTQIVTISPEDFSFGYSLNKGIDKAIGEICVIVSAHCHPSDDLWLKSLIAPFSNNQVMMTYGNQRGAEETKFSEQRLFGKLFGEETILDDQVPFANNANSAIRRSFWQNYRFNEAVTGFEDLDWAKHVRHEGFKISYIAEALVYHVHDETWAQIYNRYFREAYAYKEIYPNEHFTFFEFVYVCAFSILQDWYVAVNRKQFMRSFTEIIFFRSLQYFATYKAYKLRGSPLSDLKRKLYYPVSSRFGMIKTRQNR